MTNLSSDPVASLPERALPSVPVLSTPLTAKRTAPASPIAAFSVSPGGRGQSGAHIQRRPVTLREANDFVQNFHRHNGRTSRDGGKFAIGAELDGKLVGVAIVGNPLSATLMDGYTAEVLRLCVNEEAPKGTCSMLYQACWRAYRAMGGRKMITYTLKTESGASLRGAGWVIVGETKPVKDGWRKNDHLNERREWTPVMGQQKLRWEAQS